MYLMDKYCKYGHEKLDPAKNKCHTCHNISNKKAREAKKQGKVLKRGIGFEFRLKEKITIEAISGCWLWTGGSRSGYGTIWCSERETMIASHRASYMHYIGPIPEGLELDHICGNTLCCNPKHLEAVTHKENVNRGKAGTHIVERAEAQTHCKHGHEYTEENTKVVRRVKNGRSCVSRACKTCARLAQAKLRLRRN